MVPNGRLHTAKMIPDRIVFFFIFGPKIEIFDPPTGHHLDSHPGVLDIAVWPIASLEAWEKAIASLEAWEKGLEGGPGGRSKYLFV